MSRFTWSYGYKSRDKADESLEDDFSNGTVGWSDKPKVESYKTFDLKTRWRVTVQG